MNGNSMKALAPLLLGVLVWACGPQVGGERPPLSGEASSGQFAPPGLPSNGGGGGGGGATAERVCTNLCALEDRCYGQDPGCVPECTDEIDYWYGDDPACMAALDAYVACLNGLTCDQLDDWDEVELYCGNELATFERNC